MISSSRAVRKQRVHDCSLTGYSNQTITTVLRRTGARTRQTEVASYKFGITNGPARRFRQEYSGTHDKMFVVFRSTSITRVSDMERELIAYSRSDDRCENRTQGGDGNYGDGPYFCYLAIRYQKPTPPPPTSVTMGILSIADLRVHEQDVIIVPFEGEALQNLAAPDREFARCGVQRSAMPAGLAGEVCFVWEADNVFHYVASATWVPYIESLASSGGIALIQSLLNRTLLSIEPTCAENLISWALTPGELDGGVSSAASGSGAT
jgi:hypothetical protein